jgi:hypothetical protein
MLPTADTRDIAVFGAVQIDVPRSFFIDRQRDFPRALRTPTRAQVQVFSRPAALADVQALDVTGDDLKELRSCRPGDCRFKLPRPTWSVFAARLAPAPMRGRESRRT